ncbi:hypothetical protein BDV33DRAFT_178388 [Aspergillus novoparasiticus]|uniref:Uncharacterized protein n=1 Tax=Aspergillus novoparasiticus TaxID=986946 RepID=A0A5N6EIW1_9EURO|nr:hypothetical protein BDV33DRAFT_178388 [Aspergillus novoparasiticus]
MDCRITVRFYRRVVEDSVTRLALYDGQPNYHDIIVPEACKMARGELVVGCRYRSCYLYRLPIDVRFRIYAALFAHDGSALEIGRLEHTGIGNLQILRTSHLIYHEASIALYHSLSYRRLFLRAYGPYSADLLRRHPKSLPCCRSKEFEVNLEYPCRNEHLNWSRPLGSVVFLIGAESPRVALHRRWAFSEFITALKAAEPLHIFSLTVVVTENWNLPGFNEKDLVNALFSGAFKFLGKISFRGFTEEERNRLCHLVHALRDPPLKIERNKTKIQGPGFSIWLCECFSFSFLNLRCIEAQGL